MPYSILITSSPESDVPVAHVQGPSLQAMFLTLIQQEDRALAVRLHDEPGYRPFTLSPLGIYGEARRFQGFWLPKDRLIKAGSVCYLRLTLLDDALFPILTRSFERQESRFFLGETKFITAPLPGAGSEGVYYQSYPELIDRAIHSRRKLKLRFLTPTSFSQGKTDLPLPVPQLVFQSYMKRFETFYQVAFLPDFAAEINYYVGIANLQNIRTSVIKSKRVNLIGFIGDVVFTIHPKTPPELIFQLNLLAEFAFFCGTGKKTALGMGQTMFDSDSR